MASKEIVVDFTEVLLGVGCPTCKTETLFDLSVPEPEGLKRNVPLRCPACDKDYGDHRQVIASLLQSLREIHKRLEGHPVCLHVKTPQ